MTNLKHRNTEAGEGIGPKSDHVNFTRTTQAGAPTSGAKSLLPALMLVISLLASAVHAEELATAVATGKVSATFRGTGSSSGDSIMVTVKKTHGGSESLKLTLSPGTRLQSGNGGEQNMVVAGVKGLMSGSNSYEPRSEIEAGPMPQTYVLDAYCAEFEKNNPSDGNGFTLSGVDPVLANILREAGGLSAEAKQAAVWIYTDKVSFAHLNQKFTVSKSDWDAATAIVQKCRAKVNGAKSPQ